MESGNYVNVIKCKRIPKKLKVSQLDLSSEVTPVKAMISSELLGFMLCSL